MLQCHITLLISGRSNLISNLLLRVCIINIDIINHSDIMLIDLALITHTFFHNIFKILGNMMVIY